VANFSTEDWKRLIGPYLDAPAEPQLLESLEMYLSLLLRWNARMNLTAVRDPAAIAQRHFGESLFAACHVPRGTSTLLDHGSGAGFPGLPIAIARPEITVTLAESQAKKATFLRQAVRELGLSAQVHARRTENLPPGVAFDVVTMRAVDDAAVAYPAAWQRVSRGGWLLVLDGHDRPVHAPCAPASEIPVPSSPGFLRLYPRP